MNPHFKFRTLPKACGTVANIFIHEYSAGHDLQDRRLLVSGIPASRHPGIAAELREYLCFLALVSLCPCRQQLT